MIKLLLDSTLIPARQYLDAFALEAQGRSSKLENSLELLSQLYQEDEQVKTALQKELVKEVL